MRKSRRCAEILRQRSLGGYGNQAATAVHEESELVMPQMKRVTDDFVARSLPSLLVKLPPHGKMRESLVKRPPTNEAGNFKHTASAARGGERNRFCEHGAELFVTSSKGNSGGCAALTCGTSGDASTRAKPCSGKTMSGWKFRSGARATPWEKPLRHLQEYRVQGRQGKNLACRA